jgi:adenine-specific DNA-methyltransferase
MATLNFKGKSVVWNHHLTVPYHQLVPQKAKSVTDKVSLDDNLVVHGDNLRALKALLPTYGGKVKCVFIDPPYNTGNEKWVYNDAVNSPMISEWLGKVVDKEDLTRHDKWLCMMLPRLKMLRELLSEAGSIFITIDGNEVHHLTMLMNEVFGPENFVDVLVWQKKVSPSNDATWFSSDHDFILVYAKDKRIWRPNRLGRTEDQLKFYTNPDKDPRGDWNSTTYTCNKTKDERPNLYYPIKNPTTGKLIYPKKTAVWAFSKDANKAHVAENRLYWGVDGTARYPRLKKFLTEVGDVVPRSVWGYSDVGHTQEAMQEFLEIFPEGGFNTPKPTRLLERIIEIASSPEKGDIILDSFAGSGATAQAILALNKKKKANRRFVLVECEDYADTVTAERIRRCIKGVKQSSDPDLKRGLPGTFSYFKLGEALEADGLLSGKSLPKYDDLARYVFYVSTGKEFPAGKLDQKSFYVGSSESTDIYLIYKPETDYLRNAALTLDIARSVKAKPGRRVIVFAPAKYLDQEQLDEFGI